MSKRLLEAVHLALIEGWVTLPSGTHIEVDDSGEIVKGPPTLKGKQPKKSQPVVAELKDGEKTGRYVSDKTTSETSTTEIPTHIEAKANIAKRASQATTKLEPGPDFQEPHEKALRLNVQALEALQDHVHKNGPSEDSDRFMGELRSRILHHNRKLEGYDWLKKQAARQALQDAKQR